ncbi:MAG: phosphoribosylanthranilate isomerase [Planctomycetia bacterium]
MDAPLLKIKICGITTPEDGLMVAEAGADAVGLNFYEPSPRYVTPERAIKITNVLPGHMIRIALFVNASIEQIFQVADQVPLDAIQLHGDETPEFLQQLHEKGIRRIVRAFRLGPDGLGPVLEYLEACRHLEASPDMVILDSYCSGEYGGTGQTTDWEAAAQFAQLKDRPQLLLAGGLSPENVAEAIRHVRPDGVDTASGVESSPGRKDPELVREFIAQVKTVL